MKFLWIIVICTLCSNVAFSQKDALASYFKQYLEDERFTFIEISPRMFQMIGKFGAEDEKEVMELVKSISSFRMITSDQITDGLQMFNSAMNLIKGKNYTDLVTVQTSDERVRIMIREEGDIIKELFMIVAERNEFVMMSITGNINLDQISRMGSSMNIQGMEKLEKIKQN